MNSFIVIAATLCIFFSSQANAFRLNRIPVKTNSALSMSVFDNAVADWSKDYPQAYALGWSVTF